MSKRHNLLPRTRYKPSSLGYVDISPWQRATFMVADRDFVQNQTPTPLVSKLRDGALLMAYHSPNHEEDAKTTLTRRPMSWAAFASMNAKLTL